MKTNIKKTLLWTFSVLLLLTVVLCVHIYFVYSPKAADNNSRIMARIDIKQPINQDEANKIAAWMYHQKGVDHVLVNPQTSIVVFTFAPLKTTGNQIANNFKATFNLKADRFMPTAKDMKQSCPMAASSYTYKIYKFIANII